MGYLKSFLTKPYSRRNRLFMSFKNQSRAAQLHRTGWWRRAGPGKASRLAQPDWLLPPSATQEAAFTCTPI